MIHPPKKDESQFSSHGNPNDSGFWRGALAVNLMIREHQKNHALAQDEAAEGTIFAALDNRKTCPRTPLERLTLEAYQDATVRQARCQKIPHCPMDVGQGVGFIVNLHTQRRMGVEIV